MKKILDFFYKGVISYIEKFKNNPIYSPIMKKILTPLALIFAASAFADQASYDYTISEDTSRSSLQGTTDITNNSTLSLTGGTPNNYSVRINAGSTLSFEANDAFKWGVNGDKYAVIDNYGTIDMVISGKEFRFGDNGGHYTTILNLHSGSVLKSSGGSFGLANFRGELTQINVEKGASIQGLSYLKTFDRADEQGDVPTFELNINGGTVTQTGNTDMGNNANSVTAGKMQYSTITVSNGGTYTVGGAMYMGNAAYNDTKLIIKDEGSTFSTNQNMYVGRRTGSIGSFIIQDNASYTTERNISLGNQNGATGNLIVDNGATLHWTTGEIQVTAANGSTGNLEVTNGATFSVEGPGTMNVAYYADSTGRVLVDNATFSMANSTSDFNLYLGKNSGTSNASMVITNGGVFQQSGAKNTQVYLNKGTSRMEITNGGKWFANANFYIGNDSTSVATLILNNGKIANASGTGASSDLILANAASAVARVEVSNGGTADLRTFRMSQGGTNSNSTLIIRDAGSYVKATNTNDSNYLFALGVNSSDAKYEGNVANLFIYTGAQLWNASTGTSWVNDSAQMNFMLVSDDLSATDTAMFRTGKLAVYKTDGSVSTPFVIDGANLSYNTDLSEGDIVEFTILTLTGSLTFNGEAADFSDTDTVAAMFEFKNNISLADWEDFDVSNLEWDGANLTLVMFYIPEPSTYAAIFGALAIALVAYRRRK